MAEEGDVELVLEEARDAMDKTIQSFRKELTRVRTGRASTNLLDGVMVDYFDTPTPLNQLANLTTPDPRLPSGGTSFRKSARLRRAHKPRHACVSAGDAFRTGLEKLVALLNAAYGFALLF